MKSWVVQQSTNILTLSEGEKELGKHEFSMLNKEYFTHKNRFFWDTPEQEMQHVLYMLSFFCSRWSWVAGPSSICLQAVADETL